MSSKFSPESVMRHRSTRGGSVNGGNSYQKPAEEQRGELHASWTTCSISGQPLAHARGVVCDRFGRLFNRDSVRSAIRGKELRILWKLISVIAFSQTYSLVNLLSSMITGCRVPSGKKGNISWRCFKCAAASKHDESRTSCIWQHKTDERCFLSAHALRSQYRGSSTLLLSSDRCAPTQTFLLALPYWPPLERSAPTQTFLLDPPYWPPLTGLPCMKYPFSALKTCGHILSNRSLSSICKESPACPVCGKDFKEKDKIQMHNVSGLHVASSNHQLLERKKRKREQT